MDYGELSICVPAYNEAGAIEQTLRDLREHFPAAEVLVVDDCSTDETGTIAAGVEGVRVLTHRRNRGYGASLKTAMRNATRDVVVWIDSDGQHRMEDLASVVAPVLAGEKDAVIGARTSGSLLKSVARIVAREPLPDLNSGLRCFRREIIARYLHLLPDGFSASTTSTLLMIKRGYLLGYVDIVTKARIGTSTVKHVRDGLAALKLIVRILVLFHAFSFFSLLGAIQLIPGLIYGVIVAIVGGRGFPTLAAMIVVSGVLTFLIGLVCDQITALRQERFEQE